MDLTVELTILMVVFHHTPVTPFNNDFKQLMAQPNFVDKTAMIEEVMKNRVSMATAAPRFGKTTNLQMLRYFLEDPDSCQTFAERGLRIFTEYPRTFHRTCGRYLVLYLDFNNLNTSSVPEMKNSYRQYLRELFSKYDCLKSSKKLDRFLKKRLARYTDNVDTLSGPKLLFALPMLASMLRNHFELNVFILMDNLHRVILPHIYNPTFSVTNHLFFIKQLIVRIFAKNDLQGFLSSRIKLPLDFNGTYYHFLEPHGLSQSYGLTTEEVQSLIVKSNTNFSITDMSEWYGGYRVLGTDTVMHNTYSVMEALQRGHLAKYWTVPESITHLQDFFLDRCLNTRIATIIRNKRLVLRLGASKSGFRLKRLQKFVAMKRVKYPNGPTEAFLLYMQESGYLVTSHKTNVSVTLQIPNWEISNHIKGKFYTIPYYMVKLNITYERVMEVVDALLRFGNDKDSYKHFVEAMKRLYPVDRVPSNTLQLHQMLLALFRDSGKFLYAEDEPSLANNSIVLVRRDGMCLVFVVSMDTDEKETPYANLLSLLKNVDVLKRVNFNAEVKSIYYLGMTLDLDLTVHLNYLRDQLNPRMSFYITSF